MADKFDPTKAEADAQTAYYKASDDIPSTNTDTQKAVDELYQVANAAIAEVKRLEKDKAFRIEALAAGHAHQDELKAEIERMKSEQPLLCGNPPHPCNHNTYWVGLQGKCVLCERDTYKAVLTNIAYKPTFAAIHQQMETIKQAAFDALKKEQ